MVLSKRERQIATYGGIFAGAMLAYYVALAPYLDARNGIATKQADARLQLANADALFNRQRKLRPVWDAMLRGGLKVDPSQAESQAMHAVVDWAQSSGVSLAALKPERSTQEGKFQVISFSLTATGPMPAVSRLVWDVETATIPIRINDAQITSRKEGTDDLSARISVSALCLPPDGTKPDAKEPADTAAATQGDEQ